MAKIILTAVLIVLLNVLVGCNDAGSGKGRLVSFNAKQSPNCASVVEIDSNSEVDIAEHVAKNRMAYRQGLALLVKYYARTGNNMKLQWAEKELASLNAAPKYNYIVEAGIPGPDLKANTSITKANYIYRDIVQLDKKARGLILIVDENLLRQVLKQYNQFIRNYPSSDKIDDAAYKAGRIHEHFKDYTIAVLYYKRACQWDPETIHPVVFKAAYILDRQLHRRAEALQLYQQAVKREGLSYNYKEFAEKRIGELTKSDENLRKE